MGLGDYHLSNTTVLMYNLHNCKVHFSKYNSLTFSIFMEFCNPHHDLILEYFHHLKKETLYPLAITPQFPQPCTASALDSNHSNFCLYRLACFEHLICGIIQYVVFCNWFLSPHVFEVYPYCSIYQYFILLLPHNLLYR